MGHKSSPFEIELYRLVDEVLFYKWDPIGISDSSWPRDEYYGYLPSAFALLLKSDSVPQDLASYLYKVTIQHMGISPRSEGHDLKIAELLFEIRDDVKSKHSIEG